MQARPLKSLMSAIMHSTFAHTRAFQSFIALAIVFMLGAATAGAYPVLFLVQGTIGAPVSGPDLLHLAGMSFTITGSMDPTTQTPVSCGTNCNTYTIPSVILSVPNPPPNPPTVVTLTAVPVSITVNTGGNPATFSMSIAPLGIPISAVVGVPAGTIASPAPDGFGVVSMLPGAPPFTFGSVLNYGKLANATTLPLTGIIDGINVLHTFTGTASDGGFPHSSLTEVSRGVFFGTTFGSAAQSLASTLFYIVGGNGTLATRHTFNPITEGTGSTGALLQAFTSMIYASNTAGGPANTGAVLQYNPKLNTVTPANTTMPVPSSMIEGADQSFYNVTSSATAPNVFFKMTTTGAVSSLHTFTAAEGRPSGPVIQASDFNFYGETTGGSSGFGMVYCMTKTGVDCTTKGQTLTPLHLFNGSDGQNPTGGLFQASNGRLYGVAAGGPSGSGVVFSLTLAGAFSVVHPFTGSDGSSPSGGLLQATDGNLYGTTSAGGVNDLGTVFRLSLANVFTVVHHFSGADGTHPSVSGPALAQGSDGKLYGTAPASVDSNGNPGAGTVFSLNLKLPRPKPAVVRFFPSSGTVGKAFLVTGRNLLGVTKATLNGINASFFAAGANYVWVVVPAGATTGAVALTTPTGTATSATSFTVN